MKLSYQELQALIDAAEAVRGRRASFQELIRCAGGSHDRHLATGARFSMSVEHVATAMSGARLLFMSEKSENAYYEIALDNVVRFEVDEAGALHLFERFEQQTEHWTHVTSLQP